MIGLARVGGVPRTRHMEGKRHQASFNWSQGLAFRRVLAQTRSFGTTLGEGSQTVVERMWAWMCVNFNIVFENKCLRRYSPALRPRRATGKPFRTALAEYSSEMSRSGAIVRPSAPPTDDDSASSATAIRDGASRAPVKLGPHDDLPYNPAGRDSETVLGAAS